MTGNLGVLSAQGNRPSSRTNALVRPENSFAAKNEPAARLPASDRVGYGAIIPANAEAVQRGEQLTHAQPRRSRGRPRKGAAR